MKRKIIFSAINVTSGGPLTILDKFMEFASVHLVADFEVCFLIREKRFLPKIYPALNLMEFPDAQRTFFHKIYYEYFYFKRLSRKSTPYLWFSLNDCSPTVEAEKRVVYIHNATPFYRLSWMDLRFPSRIVLQKFYYRLFLQTNLSKNSFVVVQQNFMKDYVASVLHFQKRESILVNPPVFEIAQEQIAELDKGREKHSLVMIYPTKAEVYKNIHRLVDAAITLVTSNSLSGFRLWLTLSGKENRYAKYLANRARSFEQISFIGKLPFASLMGHLQASDIMVFPSKLETWGLPLSEAAYFGKIIVAADLPYARETLRGYTRALYFDPESTQSLVDKILQAKGILNGESVSEQPLPVKETERVSLNELFRIILQQI